MMGKRRKEKRREEEIREEKATGYMNVGASSIEGGELPYTV